MIEFIQSFGVMDWFTAGTLGGSIVAAVATIVCAIIDSKGHTRTQSHSKNLTDATNIMVDKLTDVKSATAEVSANLQTAINAIDAALDGFKQGLIDNQNQNLTVAAFVLECFNQSNLSDDKKAKLQTMFDQMFYTDKTQLVNKLHEAKAAAEKTAAEQIQIAQQLEAENNDLKAQLANATNVPKKSRRV